MKKVILLNNSYFLHIQQQIKKTGVYLFVGYTPEWYRETDYSTVQYILSEVLRVG